MGSDQRQDDESDGPERLGAAHSRLAIAYVVLVVAAVVFAQVRGHPAWTYWLTALILCIPCIVYCWPCAYIALNLLHMSGPS